MDNLGLFAVLHAIIYHWRLPPAPAVNTWYWVLVERVESGKVPAPTNSPPVANEVAAVPPLSTLSLFVTPDDKLIAVPFAAAVRRPCASTEIDALV